MSQLELSSRGAVRILAINRPDCLNALTGDMFQQLARLLDEVAADDEARAVVLTGRGRSFSSGGDIRDMGESLDLGQPDAATEYLFGLTESARLLAEMPKPTIAAISGAAAGAGMSLALACDFRVMSVGAVLTTAFARLGVAGDFGISYFLTQLVGAGRARELLMTSPRMGAEEAARLGLVHSVVPEELLHEEVLTLAENLASGPTRAFGWIKQNVNRAASGMGLADALRAEAANMVASLGTEDHREAARAFLDKREPRFSGR